MLNGICTHNRTGKMCGHHHPYPPVMRSNNLTWKFTEHRRPFRFHQNTKRISLFRLTRFWLFVVTDHCYCCICFHFQCPLQSFIFYFFRCCDDRTAHKILCIFHSLGVDYITNIFTRTWVSIFIRISIVLSIWIIMSNVCVSEPMSASVGKRHNAIKMFSSINGWAFRCGLVNEFRRSLKVVYDRITKEWMDGLRFHALK